MDDNHESSWKDMNKSKWMGKLWWLKKDECEKDNDWREIVYEEGIKKMMTNVAYLIIQRTWMEKCNAWMKLNGEKNDG